MLNIATTNRERVRDYGGEKERELTVAGDGDAATVTQAEDEKSERFLEPFALESVRAGGRAFLYYVLNKYHHSVYSGNNLF